MVQIVVFAEVRLLVYAHTICRALRPLQANLQLFVCEYFLSQSRSSMPFMGYPVRTSYLMPVPTRSPPLPCAGICCLSEHFSTQRLVLNLPIWNCCQVSLTVIDCLNAAIWLSSWPILGWLHVLRNMGEQSPEMMSILLKTKAWRWPVNKECQTELCVTEKE